MSNKKDGIYAYVTGTVSNVGFTKYNDMYAQIEMVNTLDDGRVFKDKATVFGLKDCIVSKGDRLTISGFLTVKAETYEKDGQTLASKNISVNGSKIREQIFSGQVETVPPVQEDSWDITSVGGDEVPF